MKQQYAPGCALMLYKPHLTTKIQRILNSANYLKCCRYEPNLEQGSTIINTCAGCDKRFRELYEGISTVSLWEILAENNAFPFPNYNGIEMTIHDACPTRTEKRVHDAIRKLLKKMNIKVIEAKKNKEKSICCGDSFYGVLTVEKVKQLMRKRANDMPCENVVVYCVSCIKAMHIGGKKPRYIVDLLFNETTTIGTYEPDEWHNELQEYIDKAK